MKFAECWMHDTISIWKVSQIQIGAKVSHMYLFSWFIIHRWKLLLCHNLRLFKCKKKEEEKLSQGPIKPNVKKAPTLNFSKFLPQRDFISPINVNIHFSMHERIQCACLHSAKLHFNCFVKQIFSIPTLLKASESSLERFECSQFNELDGFFSSSFVCLKFDLKFKLWTASDWVADQTIQTKIKRI